MLTEDDLAKLRALIEGILDARGLTKTPNDISEKRRAAALLRWANKRKADRAADANAMQSASPAKPRKQRASQANAMQLHNGVAVWDAYRQAYLNRYGVDPIRNVRTNAILAQFAARIPGGEAPAVAAFYLTSNKAFYVSAKHSCALLLRDAEGLHTEWVTGRSVTDTEARQADATAARGNVWNTIIEEHHERGGSKGDSGNV